MMIFKVMFTFIAPETCYGDLCSSELWVTAFSLNSKTPHKGVRKCDIEVINKKDTGRSVKF